ncbi:MAG: hypothetical protein RML12_04695 [Xanthomonadales bacterium]|nr:hypothetical protein [Xanthomonadales bacterium]
MSELPGKIGITLLAVVVAAAYLRHYGARNFLWFSDLALFLGTLAWWLESALLASMVAVGVLLPELFWAISLTLRLVLGRSPGGLTDYLFDARRPRWLRLLSLFHLLLPPLLLHLLASLGYDPRAPWLWLPLALAVLAASARFGSAEENLNWTRPPGALAGRIGRGAWLACWIPGYFLLVVAPSHLLLAALFAPPAA